MTEVFGGFGSDFYKGTVKDESVGVNVNLPLILTVLYRIRSRMAVATRLRETKGGI